jgi:Tol biopolymer transport system component
MPVAGIFISYRRSDNPDATGRIYDRLVEEFGKAHVFKDVDSIPLGQDFRGHLKTIVSQCGVMLAIVGPGWMDTRDKFGKRRLEDPSDFVRIELEAALARDIPVVPVLVGHAPIPLSSELPESLASMAFRQSINVRPDPDFHHDATRLVDALREILGPNAPRAVAPSVARAAGRSRLWMGACAVLAIALAAFAIPALKYLNQTPPPETRTDIVTPATDDPRSFAIAPDGRRIVFAATGDGTSRLWLRSLNKATAQPLAGTEGAVRPFWSPDSKSIGFFTSGYLKRLDLDGGQPQILANADKSAWGSWSSKGVILFSKSALDPISSVAASGGQVSQLPLLGQDALSNLFPVFLPDGEHFLFRNVYAVNGHSAGMAIELGSLKEGRAVRLASMDQSVVSSTPVAYLVSSGRVLWIRPDDTLVSQQLDLSKKALVGEIVPLADAVSGVSASATGVVAYRTNGAGGLRQLTWVDRSGALQGTVGAAEESLSEPRLSPDGKQIAFTLRTQGKKDVWRQDGERKSRVTFGKGTSDSPVWSPDGRMLAFRNEEAEGGTSGFYQKRADGAGSQEPLLINNLPEYPTNWSKEGYLLYFSVTEKSGTDISVLPLTGTRKPSLFLHNDIINVWPMCSPDGKWVAYQSNATGRFEIYVRPFVNRGAAAQDAQWQVSTNGGGWPVWSADGKELYFIDPAGMMMAAPMRFVGSSAVPGTPVTLFQTNILGGGTDLGQGRQYDVDRNGRFLINRMLNTGTGPITLIQNWDPIAKAN